MLKEVVVVSGENKEIFRGEELTVELLEVPRSSSIEPLKRILAIKIMKGKDELATLAVFQKWDYWRGM